MSLAELLPSVRQLPASDKLRLIRILAEELEPDEYIYPLQPNRIYYLPTSYNSFGVGRLLLSRSVVI
jgi:hypothetical protein